jgi:phospholipase/carboxylesterase/glyoxalase family protein
VANVHRGQPVLHAGAALDQATAAMLLVHGRGADAEDILALGRALMRPGWAYLAPQAAGGAWYPNGFMAPIESNQPYLGWALEILEELVATVEAAVPLQRVVLLGFSQGACLTLEFAARHARRYGGVVGFSGGLIGPEGTPRDYPGSFSGTPVFLGCSDVDPHIPKARVEHTAEVLRKMDADVTMRIYERMGHTVNQDELAFAAGMLATLEGRPVDRQ